MEVSIPVWICHVAVVELCTFSNPFWKYASSFLFFFKQQYFLCFLANEMQVSFEDRWTGFSWRGNLRPRTREDAVKPWTNICCLGKYIPQGGLEKGEWEQVQLKCGPSSNSWSLVSYFTGCTKIGVSFILCPWNHFCTEAAGMLIKKKTSLPFVKMTSWLLLHTVGYCACVCLCIVSLDIQGVGTMLVVLHFSKQEQQKTQQANDCPAGFGWLTGLDNPFNS